MTRDGRARAVGDDTGVSSAAARTAGASTRFGDKHYKKPYAILAGRAVWLHSAELFLNRDDVKQLVVVVAEEDREDFDRRFGAIRAGSIRATPSSSLPTTT